ncbi:hypothetical protein BDR07DRAFT_865482 [Suillus spraguei]|nr:hypothetical protein BDR07DRAFT_865482 [Suillus spraguei]
MPRSTRSPTDAQDSIRRGSLRRKTNISIMQLPEYRHPSITPEQDVQMFRTFSHGGTASTTSSYRAPSVLDILFSSDLHDTRLERAIKRIPMDRARDRERATSYTYAEARASVTTTPQRLDDRYLSSVAPIMSSTFSYTRPVESASSTVPIVYSRPADSPSSTGSSDSTRPPPSASRLTATRKSLTSDDGCFQSNPSPKGWTSPSRSPYDTHYETLRSLQTPEEIPRSWQSSNLRARLSSQGMRYVYNGESVYDSARPVHPHHEVSDGEYDERQMRQGEDSVSLWRREEVARREQELRRKEEETRREEAKLKEQELKRKKEETWLKEDEIRRKEVETRLRQEEADRKELEVRRMEEEARKKEETRQRQEELDRIELEVRRMEEEERRREEEIKRKIQQNEFRKREEKICDDNLKLQTESNVWICALLTYTFDSYSFTDFHSTFAGNNSNSGRS